MTLRRNLPAAVMVVAGLSLPAIATVPSSGTVSSRGGGALYARAGCYTCHGYVGQGSPLTGPALAGRKLAPAATIAYVRAPAGLMPPYRVSVLADDDLAAIAGYIATLPAGRPASAIPDLAPGVPRAAAPAPAAKGRMPLGIAIASAAAAPVDPAIARGRAVYGRNCAACHGAERQGGLGPALTREATKRTHAATAALIRNPPAGMPVLTPKPISEAQLADLVTYLHGGARNGR